jgi:hypothetical protein
LLKQKVAQKVEIILGYFILSKNHNEPPKVAQLSKIAQSGHPVADLFYTITIIHLLSIYVSMKHSLLFLKLLALALQLFRHAV